MQFVKTVDSSLFTIHVKTSLAYTPFEGLLDRIWTNSVLIVTQ